AHEDGLGPIRAIVVAAQREAPLVTRFGLPTAGFERGPGNAPLDSPARVAVAGLVERSVQRDDGLVPQERRGGEVLGPAAARGERAFEDELAGVRLKLVILGPRGAGLEE